MSGSPPKSYAPSRPLLVGQVLYGYCCGAFGRDSYPDKRVEGAGADWVVAREIGSERVVFAKGKGVHQALAAHTHPELSSQ